MWISPDSWPYMTDTSTGKAGFFFAVSGFPEASKSYNDQFKCEVFNPRTLRFHFKNMSNQIKLLSYGHMPVYLEVDNATYLKLIKGQLPFYRQKWKRMPGECDYFRGDEGVEAVFHYSLRHDLKKNDHIFFAYIYPYNFLDYEYSLKEME